MFGGGHLFEWSSKPVLSWNQIAWNRWNSVDFFGETLKSCRLQFSVTFKRSDFFRLEFGSREKKVPGTFPKIKNPILPSWTKMLGRFGWWPREILLTIIGLKIGVCFSTIITYQYNVTCPMLCKTVNSADFINSV